MARWIVCLLVLAQLALAATPPRNLGIASTRQQPPEERRTALVIGNAAYRYAPLLNPVNDARAIAAQLRQLDFTVTLLEDADQERMFEAIRQFGDSLRSGGVGVFYYAGHGVQMRGRNYLIPVAAQIEREDEIVYRSIDANQVLDKMESARNRVNIVILDACRNNPFAKQFRALETGLAVMDAPVNTLIAFATAPGATASDGTGNHGLYTRHLLANIPQPGLRVEDVFKRVRAGVRADSAGRQIPWENTSLEVDFYFRPLPTQLAAPPPVEVDGMAIELAFWESIRQSSNPADFRAYLNKYPKGQFAELAANRLRLLHPPPATPTQAATPPVHVAPVSLPAPAVAPPAPARPPTVAPDTPVAPLAADLLLRLSGHRAPVTTVSVTPDRRYVVTGSRDQSVRLWELASGVELKRYTGHGDTVLAAVVSPDGRHVLSGSADTTARLWDLRSGAELKRLSAHSGAVTAVAFAPNGRYAISGSLDGTVRLWSLPDGAEFKRFDAHRGGVRSVAFSPDGRYLLSGGNDRAMRLWDLSSGREVQSYLGHRDAVINVAFSPDGRSVVSAGADNAVRYWDTQSGAEQKQFAKADGTLPATLIALAADTRSALAARPDGSVALWDMTALQEVRQYPRQSSEIGALALSADGRLGLVASSDNTVAVLAIKR